MTKSIIKETLIMLLLCVAIVLILGVIFYDYIPANKTVPNKLAQYTTPESIQNEIKQEVVEMEKENVTYTITGADLNLYKKTNSFVSGKPDPFSATIVSDETEEGGENNNDEANNTDTNNSDNKNSNSTNSTKPTDPNSTGTFFNDEGLK